LVVINENTLRVFKNTVLRKILRPEGWEVTGSWRILHSEKLQDYLVDIRKNEMGGACCAYMD